MYYVVILIMVGCLKKKDGFMVLVEISENLRVWFGKVEFFVIVKVVIRYYLVFFIVLFGIRFFNS